MSDSTIAVHPERYKALVEFADTKGMSLNNLIGAGAASLRNNAELKKILGDFTFNDVIMELEKPGRDPRSQFEVINFREDIHELKDLQLGMVCPGVVTNVTNFGAFVDIGVHQDGLVHISQLSDNFVKDPRSVVNPGDKVKVRVLEVNLEKRQIALTMKTEGPIEANKSDSPKGIQSPRSKSPSQKSQAVGDREASRGAPRQYNGATAGNNPFANLGVMLQGKK